MTGLSAEFEQRFSEVLPLMAATAPRGAMGAVDPHMGQRPEQDSRSPPHRHRRDLSPETEPLPHGSAGLRQQLELHHTAQPSRGTKATSRRTEDGPGQHLASTIRGGEDYATAIVRGRYRGVCHRCSRSSSGVGPESLEQLIAENTARLAPSLARPGRPRSGAIARSTPKPIPVPALCRPPTSHWRAGARVDVGRPHERLDQPLRGNSPTPGLALQLSWCGAGSLPAYHRCQPQQQGN
jgi:hypothetical protein